MARLANLLALALVLLAACEQASPNQPPRLLVFQATPVEGEVPLKVHFTWNAQDPEGAPLTCTLRPEAGVQLRLSPCDQGYTYTYANPGEHTVGLEVQDPRGATAQRQIQVRVRPKRDFTLALNPTSLTVQQGAQGTTTLTITPQNGFSGTVNLSLVGAPSGVSLSPTQVNVPGTGPVNQTLTLSVGSSVAPGTYALRVRATAGSLVREADLPLTVTQASGSDFSMSLESASLSVQQGGTVYVRLSVIGTYSGQVALSLVDASQNPFSGVTLSPTSTPVPSAPMLQLTASATLNAGAYNLFVRGTGGNLVREVPLTLTVNPAPSFTLSSPTPQNLTLTPGGSGSFQATLTPKNGFSGTVSLSLLHRDTNTPINGLSLSPGSLNLAGSPLSQTFTVSVAPSVPPNTYPLKLRAEGGGVVQEANLDLVVNPSPPPPDFTLTLNPTSLTIQQGAQGTATLTITPQHGFTGTVNLSLVGAPSGVSLSPTSLNVSGPSPVNQTLTLSVGSSVTPGTYNLKVRATAGSLAREADLPLTVSPSSSVNLRIAKAEWGQTVLKESLRLVAGKPALLRVHLLASPTPLSLGQPLSGAVYLNSTFQGNLTFACPSPIPTATDPGNLATTCNATLPKEWVAPGLRVELRADPANQVAETDETDNALSLSPSLGAGTVLHLTVVPVVHQGQNASIPTFAETLWRIWPLKEISFTQRAPYTFSGTLSSNDSSGWSQLLNELRLLRQQDGSGRYYYGFVRVSYTSGIAGIGYIGFPVAVGWDYPQSAPTVMAHELGHNFGRGHAPCGVSGDPDYPYPNGRIGTWGYDLASGTLRNPGQFYDLMSYCNPVWISDYNYEKAQAFLETNPPRPQSLAEEGLLLSGRIQGDEVVFNPPLLTRALPEGEPSFYRLRANGLEVPVYTLLDSEGTLHFQARLPKGTWGQLALFRGNTLLKEFSPPLLPQAEPQVVLREENGFLWVRWTVYPFLSLFHLAGDGTRTPLGLWHRGGESRFLLEGLPPGGSFEVQLSDGLNVLTLRFPR
jgi:uncharacterized membrane protein